MPELRARKHHRDRVAETLREEIGTMIQGELSDPRISFAYVSEVVLAPGGKSARVFVAIDGGPEEERETLAGLDAARGYIRHELLERMGKRHVPDLSFQIDRSQNLKSRIDDLMGRSKRSGKNIPASPAEQSASASKDAKD
ncbi:MAG TPA: 30S ribosome-binding factor RbfA [Acidobacteriaceae bacterium]|jgi:ribosome-binding factor A|nr:30S ribosome-binding factor RbfA [Acidobacteriaceae bacterium]